MTFIANLWFSLVSAFLKPFMKFRDDKLKLAHAIEMDKVSAQQRHIDTILESQKELVSEMRMMSETNATVLREWLEGFHKLPTAHTNRKPPVNNDERMWELEMRDLASKAGKDLVENLSPYEIEAIIQREINAL